MRSPRLGRSCCGRALWIRLGSLIVARVTAGRPDPSSNVPRYHLCSARRFERCVLLLHMLGEFGHLPVRARTRKMVPLGEALCVLPRTRRATHMLYVPLRLCMTEFASGKLRHAQHSRLQKSLLPLKPRRRKTAPKVFNLVFISWFKRWLHVPFTFMRVVPEHGSILHADASTAEGRWFGPFVGICRSVRSEH